MHQAFVMIIHRHRHHLFGFVLAYHILVEKGFDFFGLIQLMLGKLFLGLFGGRFWLAIPHGFLQNMVGIFDTGIANIPVHTRKEQIHVLFGPATNTTFLIYLFSHYFFRRFTIQ